jgi:hypothetical protein
MPVAELELPELEVQSFDEDVKYVVPNANFSWGVNPEQPLPTDPSEDEVGSLTQ